MKQKKQKHASQKKQVVKLKPWQYILLFAVPTIVFGSSMGFGFVYHDDDKMILENPMVKNGIDLETAFTTDAWFMDARIELYRPWQSITYMLDYAMGGEKPFMYHFHNFIAYLLGIWLLFVFLKFYFTPILAWAGALLYSVNLLVPHAVGWIAARGDLYLMIFGLTFLILLLKYLRTNSASSLWLSVAAFFMAMLSKESAIALLPVAFIMIYAEKKRIPNAKEWAWLGANVLAFVLYFMMRKGAIADAGNLSAKAFGTNLRSIGEELFKMIFPLGFSVMPGYSIAWTLLGLILIGAVIFLMRKYKVPQTIFWVGAAILLFSLLPSMVYEPSFAGVAYDYLDHRTWFPFVGAWMIILGIVDQSGFMYKKSATYVFGGVLVLWSALNLWRIGTYADWEPYYKNALSSNPGSGLANLNYGSMLRDAGKWEEALTYTEKGVQLSPDYTDAKVRLAEVYFQLKRYQDAVNIATAALQKEPNNIQALQFRGSAYGAGKQPQLAEQDFKKILEIDPGNQHAMFNLSIAYKELNKVNEAIDLLTKLIAINPDFPLAYFERGFAYGRLNDFNKAAMDMEMSIKLTPDHAPSYFFRGRCYAAVGNQVKACEDWKKAGEMGLAEAAQMAQQMCPP